MREEFLLGWEDLNKGTNEDLQNNKGEERTTRCTHNTQVRIYMWCCCMCGVSVCTMYRHPGRAACSLGVRWDATLFATGFILSLFFVR